MRSLFSQEDAMREYGDERAAEGRAKGRAEGRAEGEICGAVNLAKDMNMTDKQIEDYLIETFKITREEAEEYLTPDPA